MELRQLECFVAVAEELHFRKAGERLGLSSSALSDRITGLETELGVDLFFRTTRQVSLTQAGSELLRDAKKTHPWSENALHTNQLEFICERVQRRIDNNVHNLALIAVN